MYALPSSIAYALKKELPVTCLCSPPTHSLKSITPTAHLIIPRNSPVYNVLHVRPRCCGAFETCRTYTQVGWSPLHYAVLGGHVAAVEALLCAGAYPCFRDNHLISPLHLASTQAGDRLTFQRIAELLGPSALLARDEVSGWRRSYHMRPGPGPVLLQTVREAFA